MAEEKIPLSESDLDRIIQRALASYEGRKNPTPGWSQANPSLLTVKPTFGPPPNNLQFQSDIFMIMPFRDELDHVYQQIIKPMVMELGLTIKRGDDFSAAQQPIIGEVWAALNASRLVIAEMTLENPNVLYELGIAHTLGKPCIMLTQEHDLEKLPFDLRHLRFIQYQADLSGSAILRQELKATLTRMWNDLLGKES